MKKETRRIEFKPNFNEDVIETLVAFANAKGGQVLVGVDDQGNPVKNFTIGNESVQKWINEIKTKTQPQIIPDWEIVDFKGSEIVELSIQEYPIKPVSTRGKYYKRVGNANHLLSVTDVVNMHLQTLNTSWDAYPDSYHKLDDISFEKVERAMEEMRKSGLTIKENPLEFLEKYDLLRERKLTNAAYLLFTKNDSYLTTIELGRFQNPVTIKDAARTKADILTQIEQVMDFIRKHANKRMIFAGEARRIEKWQYPLEAIREIVVNMIIHRDYRSSSDSIVKIYNHKIEFYNPGRLPDEITVEKLLSGKYKSTPRNKIIAGICKDMQLIEKYGSGIGRVREHFKAEGLPEPEFENISDGFQVTAYGHEFFIEKENEQVDKRLNDTVGGQVREQVNSQVNTQVNTTVNATVSATVDATVNATVKRMISIMSDIPVSPNEIREMLVLKQRQGVFRNYIQPALKLGLIEMTIPDKPNSRLQKYRLTEKGKEVKNKLL